MNCLRCDAEMFKANLVGGNPYMANVMLKNKKKGLCEPEKRGSVSCYVCPNCGHVELIADDPKKLMIN